MQLNYIITHTQRRTCMVQHKRHVWYVI